MNKMRMHKVLFGFRLVLTNWLVLKKNSFLHYVQPPSSFVLSKRSVRLVPFLVRASVIQVCDLFHSV